MRPKKDKRNDPQQKKAKLINCMYSQSGVKKNRLNINTKLVCDVALEIGIVNYSVFFFNKLKFVKEL